MELVALVTVIILIEYFVFVMMVGTARHKTGIKAPATSGHPLLERTFRVQMNTLEQLAVVLPTLWLFGLYVHAMAAAGLGLLFVIGRALYYFGYVADPAKRGTGFGIGFLATIVLILGSLYGTGMAAFNAL